MSALVPLRWLGRQRLNAKNELEILAHAFPDDESWTALCGQDCYAPHLWTLSTADDGHQPEPDWKACRKCRAAETKRSALPDRKGGVA
jgi:hypothetical protein